MSSTASTINQDMESIQKEILQLTEIINSFILSHGNGDNTVDMISSSLSRRLNSDNDGGSFQFLPDSAAYNSGNTAWLLISSALVLFMTMPGIALYYAGMVNAKNVLAMAMQIFTITALISFLWFAFGYSLTFAPTAPVSASAATNENIDNADYTSYDYGESTNWLYGNGQRLWLQGMQLNTVNQVAPTVPEAVFCGYQLMFAIITPALICGSFADRVRYFPFVLFMGLWHLLVYCPIAHSVWHPDGWLKQLGLLDYAGGNVVHISSGIAGLMTCIVIGNRKGWRPNNYDTMPPHNILLTFMGMCFVWIGWFGFNGGSGDAASPNASYAVLNTQIATSIASLTWLLTETKYRQKPSVLGMVNGGIAGLVCITPACGYVDANAAFFIGLIGGCLCYFGSIAKHHIFHIDDALHAFGVHATGGIIGLILTGFFAQSELTGKETQQGVFYSSAYGPKQLGYQCVGIVFTLAYSGVISYIILIILDNGLPLLPEWCGGGSGLRVSAEEEDIGLDESLHGVSLDGQHFHGDLIVDPVTGEILAYKSIMNIRRNSSSGSGGNGNNKKGGNQYDEKNKDDNGDTNIAHYEYDSYDNNTEEAPPHQIKKQAASIAATKMFLSNMESHGNVSNGSSSSSEDFLSGLVMISTPAATTATVRRSSFRRPSYTSQHQFPSLSSIDEREEKEEEE